MSAGGAIFSSLSVLFLNVRWRGRRTYTYFQEMNCRGHACTYTYYWAQYFDWTYYCCLLTCILLVHWYGVCFFLRGRFVCLHVQLISTVQSATVHNMHASCFTGVWMHTYVPSDPSPAKQNVKRRCQMISCVRYVVALVPSSSTCSDTNKCITVFSLKKNVSLWQHACMINCTKSRALVRACMQISMWDQKPSSKTVSSAVKQRRWTQPLRILRPCLDCKFLQSGHCSTFRLYLTNFVWSWTN